MSLNIAETNARSAAAAILIQWLKSGDFPDRQLERIERHRAFVMELVYGVIRSWRLLEELIHQRVQREPDSALHAILAQGFYELLFMTESEDYAAVNETVQIAKKEKGPQQANFVNALLRRVQREKQEILEQLPKLPLALRTSHPDMLVNRWIKNYGAKRVGHLCEWNNTRAETVIRVCLSRIELDEFNRRLRESGVAAKPHPFRPESFLILPRGVGVAQLPGYRDGWFSVQDPATVIATELLAVKPGERVLDACAAPGGKTAIMAEAMKETGTLIASDMHDDRLALLHENLERLKYSFVDIQKNDAVVGTFDKILLDVPCSNTGVIRRKPDIRWRFSEERLQKLLKTQKSILSQAAEQLNIGGRMVYSTCSLEPEENEFQTQLWLREHPAFALLKEAKTFPSETQTDGAYAALLEKRA